MTSVSAVVDTDGSVVREDDDGPIAWWSLTKTAIAALALRLSDQGRFDLDRPEPGAPYSLRQLLSHTGGLPDYGALPAYQAAVAAGEPPWSREELLRRVGGIQPAAPPGRDWRYSNVGYLLARHRLEERTGLPLGDALARHVLEPLEIADTRLATTMGDMANLLLPPPHPYHPGWVFHGTLIGPASGAARFVDRLARPGFLSPAGHAALLRGRRLDPSIAEPPWRAPAYGLGMMLGEWAGADGTVIEVAGHGAGGPGSEGATFRLSRRGRTVTVATYAGIGGVRPEVEAMHIASRFLTD